jgi:uncharacterized protein (DUF2237 family)
VAETRHSQFVSHIALTHEYTMPSRNVLGSDLLPCSYDPLTGFYRDGCCQTDDHDHDHGTHVVCARMTQAFLDFSRQQGNDLITARPEYRFAGLKAGDRWCLCVNRWLEAFESGAAPPVYLKSTHAKALETLTLAQLQAYAAD